MTYTDVREWAAILAGVLILGIVIAMIVGELLPSARRRRAKWPLLSGGAPRPVTPQAPTTFFYANAHRDNPPGEEGPPSYHAPGHHATLPAHAFKPDVVLLRAVERWVQWFESNARTCGKARLEGDLSGLRSIIARAQRANRIAPADAEALMESAEKRVWAAFTAPKARIARRRDGKPMSDEATAALIREVFGEEPPRVRQLLNA